MSASSSTVVSNALLLRREVLFRNVVEESAEQKTEGADTLRCWKGIRLRQGSVRQTVITTFPAARAVC